MDLTSCPASPKQWERNLKSKGVTVLHCTIRRPTFSDTGKQNRMERYFTRMEQLWQARWENKMYSLAQQAFADQPDQSSFSPWHASMDYRVTYWDPPLLSIRIDIREQGPVSPPISQCVGETWDCSSGYPCPLRAFLPAKPRHWKRTLTEQLKEQAQQRMSSGESLLNSNCLSVLKQAFDPNRFYLTEDGIVVFYPLYALGSYGEGIPTFTIPVSHEIQSNKFRALSITAQR